jgi:YggT family protein
VEAVGFFIQVLCIVLIIAIWIRIIFSWTGMDPANPIYQIVHEITEPILGPIRSLMPRLALDLSPMIASFILFILINVGQRLREG